MHHRPRRTRSGFPSGWSRTGGVVAPEKASFSGFMEVGSQVASLIARPAFAPSQSLLAKWFCVDTPFVAVAVLCHRNNDLVAGSHRSQKRTARIALPNSRQGGEGVLTASDVQFTRLPRLKLGFPYVCFEHRITCLSEVSTRPDERYEHLPRWAGRWRVSPLRAAKHPTTPSIHHLPSAPSTAKSPCTLTVSMSIASTRLDPPVASQVLR
ncbi:hypothetical protein P171DRAFT_145480 [Karstenula rhodostoma CBS 690.94]|uniref:Uncharacterized protein n=1 Tax=Karstenula rhodostoma CBS 690.94 TaxID=1392251 RepID=A0A9P4UG57_9PLEO|nr:hypothetical protein P171DRAFT_145480 [Karstenula rhodostoma CBS 690.94]